MSAMVTWAPASESASTQARPIPCPPPVTRATRPLRLKRSRYIAPGPVKSSGCLRLVRQIGVERRPNAIRPQRGEIARKGLDIGGRRGEIAEYVVHRQKSSRVFPRRLRRSLQPLPARIVRRNRPAVLRYAAAIAAPQSRHEGEPSDARAGLQAIPDGRKNEFRLPVRSVETEARNGVGDLRVGETFRDFLAIGLEID